MDLLPQFGQLALPISSGRLRSMAMYAGAKPDMAASEARMWTANQAARRKPY